MAFHTIYFLILLTFVLWAVALGIKNNLLGILSAFLMLPISIWIFINGIDVFPHDSLLSVMFAGVIFILAIYTIAQSAEGMFQNL